MTVYYARKFDQPDTRRKVLCDDPDHVADNYVHSYVAICSGGISFVEVCPVASNEESWVLWRVEEITGTNGQYRYFITVRCSEEDARREMAENVS